jgi:hypothetical protein
MSTYHTDAAQEHSVGRVDLCCAAEVVLCIPGLARLEVDESHAVPEGDLQRSCALRAREDVVVVVGIKSTRLTTRCSASRRS